MSWRHGVLGLALVGFLALAPSAGASTVIVGSPLTSEFKGAVAVSGFFSSVTNSVLDEGGAHLTSPVTGTIVRWRTKGTFAGPFRLRVLRPAGGETLIGAGASSFQTPVGTAIQAFPTQLPIQAGDTIGLEAEKEEATYGVEPTSTPHALLWSPAIPEGAPGTPVTTLNYEVGFDAEVVPTPTLILIGPATGPLAGGTAVTIAGRDFEGATAVKFGPNAASANFTVNSENQITAVAPPGAQPGTVDVTVTTPGGTSATVPGGQFTYTAPPPPSQSCTVPKLIGKTLKEAQRKLAKAHCALGKVTRQKGAKGRTAKVFRQSPKPGQVLASGAKVKVSLGG